MNPRSLHRMVVLTLGLVSITGCRDEFEPTEDREIPGVAFATGGTTDTAFATMDTYIHEGKPDENFGDLHRLRLRKRGRNRALVLFDQTAILAAVGTGSLVSATLELTIRSDKNDDWPPAGGTIDAHRLNQSWTELGATWHCAVDSDVTNSQADCPAASWDMAGAPPWEPSATAQAPITNGQTGVVSFDVTQDVAAFLGGTANHGWIVKKTDESQPGTVLFHSRDVNQASNIPPALILTVAASTVPPQAPDTLPAWVYSDSNIAQPSPSIDAPFLQNIIVIEFKAGTSLAEREAAIAAVNGSVVGGVPLPVEGHYYIQITDSLNGAGLVQAAAQLRQLPQVQLASFETTVDFNYRRPTDGPDWDQWKLLTDSADGKNWALEAVAAPLAWGCTTGDPNVSIAVVDGGFTRVGGVDSMKLQFLPRGATHPTDDHGTNIASIIAARGNDSLGMTGMMWDADLHGYEIYDSTTTLPIQFHMNTMAQLKKAAFAGARVINISLGIVNGRQDSAHVDRVKTYYSALKGELLAVQAQGLAPLVVLSAGNDPIDARWNGYPTVDSAGFETQVLVVAASTINHTLWPESSTGILVDVAAPGENVYFLTKDNIILSDSGSSLSAPIVTGLAGLLLSFDSTLTADSLHHYIVQGAIRGGKTAGGIPIINAYESLKMAAERVGAPLCGNRVWVENNQIVVQRGSGSEVLYSGGTPVGLLVPYHGGRRVDFTNDQFVEQSLVYANGQWTVTDPASAPPAIWSGTFNSISRSTHDGDSVAYTVGTDLGSSEQVDVRLGTISSTGRFLGGAIVISRAKPNGLAYTGRRANYDSTGSWLGTYSITDSSLGASNYEDLQATSSPSPLGDRVLVKINVLSLIYLGLTGWIPCSGAMFQDGAWTCEQKFLKFETRSKHAEIWSVPWNGGAGTHIVTIPNETMGWLGAAEDGNQLVLASGTYFQPFGPPVPNPYSGCAVSYRDGTTGTLLGTPVPHDLACFTSIRGAGGIAPIRAGLRSR